MAEYQVLSWRGIPAQVRVKTAGSPRRLNAKLPNRYQEEIDKVAMEEGLFGSDDYLEHWKWGPAQERDGEPQTVLDAVVAELLAEWDEKLFGRPFE